MSTINVTKADGTAIVTGATVRWLTMTPWVGSPITKHIVIPGGRGAGRTFVQGVDNAVATINGAVLRNSYGVQFLKALPGMAVIVTNGVDSATEGTVGAVHITDSQPASVKFSITVTEVAP